MQRRDFLKSTLGGVTSALAPGASPWIAPASAHIANPALYCNFCFNPDTLFLTWQGDSTTTMTVQWIEPVTDANRSVFGGPLNRPTALRVDPITKPFSDTDWKVHRAELTGLKPDTEYQFEIGATSPVFRFRTMP